MKIKFVYKKWFKRFFPFVLLLLFSFITQIYWSYWTGFKTNNQNLKIWVFDIGQGSSALFEFPNGHKMLLDGGPNALVLSKVGSVLPSYNRKIDMILASHPDSDHVAGLIETGRTFSISEFADPGVFERIPLEDSLMSIFEQKNTKINKLHSGDVWQEGEVLLRIISPSDVELSKTDTNSRSLVLEVLYGDRRILLMGDATEETEERLVAEQIGDVDVLVVGHHGSISSSSVKFLEETKPEWAIISVGEDNSYGHPHPVVLDRLKEFSAQIMRTDQVEDILIETDSKNISVISKPLPF